MAERAAEGDETLTPNDAINVLEELLEAQSHSYVLGLKLQLPLTTVEAICETNSKPRDRLLQVLIEFTRQTDPRPTWKVIIAALRSPALNLNRLAMILEAAHGPGLVPPADTTFQFPKLQSPPPMPAGATSRLLSDTPTLPGLLGFKTLSGNSINIAKEIGKHYSTLGPLLLNDDSGAITSVIVSQHQRDAASINCEILMQWVQGKGKHPVSWSTLIAVLKEVHLTLAQQIEEDMIEAQIQDYEQQNTEWCQRIEVHRKKMQTIENSALKYQQIIRQKEAEKDAKEREIAEAQKQLRQLRQEEKSSSREIEDLQKHLQSNEGLVANLKRTLERRDLVLLKTKVSGPGLESATANQKTFVTVNVTDSIDKPCSVLQKVTAELVSVATPTNPSTIPTVQATSPSQYEVSYKPISRGRHKLHVRLNDVEIADSPFTMTVYPDPTQLAHPARILENLITPYSIAFNSRGEMFITEKLAHHVSIFDTEEKKDRVLGSLGDMIHPQGIAIDGSDNIYVSSYNKLQKFTSSGELIACARGINFRDPYGVTLYKDDVYVCDCNNHCIKVFDLDLNFIRSIGSYGKERGQFNTPYDVKFDTNGWMYVAEWGNERVQVMDNYGHFIRVFGVEEDGKLLRPSTLNIVDKYVYVSDYSGGCIVVYETSGEFVAKFGGWGQEEGKFIYPYCISSSSDGYIYVCDRENKRVQIF